MGSQRLHGLGKSSSGKDTSEPFDEETAISQGVNSSPFLGPFGPEQATLSAFVLRYCLLRNCSVPFRWSSETELPGRLKINRRFRGFLPVWMSTGSADAVP